MPIYRSILRPSALGLFTAILLTSGVWTMGFPSLSVTSARADIQSFDRNRGIADLVDQVIPAVVSIQAKITASDATKQTRGLRILPNLPEDSPFRQFFEQMPQFRDGPDQEDSSSGIAAGSGFIVSSDGYIVTNNHVIKDSEEVTITLENGEKYTAKLVGSDPKTDLALLKINANKALPTVKFATTEPRVGDWVMAIGNPFSFGGTVTTGIVSGRGRVIGAGPYDDFLQIDAAINRGNSGGPSFNTAGEVIGVNTIIISPSGGSVGLGLAIPAAVAADVVNKLKDKGTVTRGWFGIAIQPVTEELAESLNLKAAKGAIVSSVNDGSPAEKAGLKTGDTVVRLDGQDIKDARDLSRKVSLLDPGKAVDVTIMRDGKEKTINVKVGEMPLDQKIATSRGQNNDNTVTNLDSLGLKLVGVHDGNGVKITTVKPGSIADQRGLQVGDIILEVAGKAVTTPADIREAVKAQASKQVLLLVRNRDGQRFVALPTSSDKG